MSSFLWNVLTVQRHLHIDAEWNANWKLHAVTVLCENALLLYFLKTMNYFRTGKKYPFQMSNLCCFDLEKLLFDCNLELMVGESSTHCNLEKNKQKNGNRKNSRKKQNLSHQFAKTCAAKTHNTNKHKSMLKTFITDCSVQGCWAQNLLYADNLLILSTQ